jgi:acyl-coenzyme A synthetase/AMP-(fatty) acid ligase
MGTLIQSLVELLGTVSSPGLASTAMSLSWRSWAEEVERARTELAYLARSRTGIVLGSMPRIYALWTALSSLGADVYLFDETMNVKSVGQLAQRHELEFVAAMQKHDQHFPDAIRNLDVRPNRSGHGMVTIFTSGTTGEPKAVRHSWETLTRPVRGSSPSGPQTWLLTYRPSLYAGIQVFMHCLVNRDALVLPDAGGSASELIGVMQDHHVNCVSATPSYWRRLITLGSRAQLQRLHLSQITLGGEASDQALLDSLKQIFPMARLVHIYATSELGRCFSVSDGRAGFPASYLDTLSREGVELKTENGELYVRSANAGLGQADETPTRSPEACWLATGDLIDRLGDRCHFVGRRTELINVGGNKVHPLRVEQVVCRIPGVAEARVYSKTSSLVGQMVACEFVASEGFDAQAVKDAVLTCCREQLAPHERPRFVEPVAQIRLSEAGKKLRSLS